jgi:hypothetical protein
MKGVIYLKKTIVILALIFISNKIIAQKTNFNFNLYTGLFSYRGDGSASSARIESGFYSVPPQASNIYGRQSAFSFCIEGQINRKTKNNFLFGGGVAYERLKSSVKITEVGFSGDPAYFLYKANGRVKLITDYLTLNPFAGKRFLIKHLSIDITSGIDIAILVSGHEKGGAVTTETKAVYTTNNYYSMIPVDFRARVQLKAGYKKLGILLGCSLGLTDYKPNINTNVYSNFIRVGVSYAIK